MTGLGGLHHAALTVADLDASARWYREVLGLEEQFREESESRRAVVLRFPAHPDMLGLVEHGAPDDGFDPRRLGLDHLALNVGSGEEMQAWAERLSGHGVEHSGVIETPFGAMLNFTDPDGIALALFWDRSLTGPDGPPT